MQAITTAIKSPIFLVVFFGTAALCAVLSGAAILSLVASPAPGYLLAGSLFFLMGTFPVTMMRNVPLNNQLVAATPDTKDGRELWKRFQASWGMWNHVRTITALALARCSSWRSRTGKPLASALSAYGQTALRRAA